VSIAKRVYNNPDNYTSESAGDYSWQGDQRVVGLVPSDDEMEIIMASAALVAAETGGWTGVGSVRTPSPYGRVPLHRHRRSNGEVWWG
jgi:hypothetical protein